MYRVFWAGVWDALHAVPCDRDRCGFGIDKRVFFCFGACFRWPCLGLVVPSVLVIIYAIVAELSRDV